MSCKVSFIGLGVMGYPMAGYISKAGHDVTVYNRTKSKAEKWIKEFKGRVADTPKEASKDCDFVFTCVGNDNDLEEVTIGKEGIYNTIKNTPGVKESELKWLGLEENSIVVGYDTKENNLSIRF